MKRATALRPLSFESTLERFSTEMEHLAVISPGQITRVSGDGLCRSRRG
jgi:hypothetical protein